MNIIDGVSLNYSVAENQPVKPDIAFSFEHVQYKFNEPREASNEAILGLSQEKAFGASSFGGSTGTMFKGENNKTEIGQYMSGGPSISLSSFVGPDKLYGKYGKLPSGGVKEVRTFELIKFK